MKRLKPARSELNVDKPYEEKTTAVTLKLLMGLCVVEKEKRRTTLLGVIHNFHHYHVYKA